MEWILTELIGSTIQSCDWIVDKILESLVPMAFYAEKYMTNASTVINFSEIYTVIFSFGVALIVLKFLKRGFDTYIVWDSGDPDSDPLALATNFLRALVVAIGFPLLYNALVNVTEDMINKIMNAETQFAALTNPTDYISRTVSSLGLSAVLFGLILIIMYALLYFQFVVRGIEMLILRMGAPIACVGLVDSDKGVFTPYLKKFFMNSATVLVQIVLIKLSLMILILSNNMIYAVAVAFAALKTPRFLSDFMLVHASGGSISNTVYHVSRLAQMAKSVIVRSPAKWGELM